MGNQTETLLKTLGHYIDGALCKGNSEQIQPVYNPATGEITKNVALAQESDVNAAVAAAKTAFASWGQVSLAKRTAILFAFRELLAANLDELAAIITSEHGKVLSDAKGELQRGLEVVEMACGIGQLLKGEFSDQVSTGIDVHSFRQPLGVVVGITPFNFPAMVPLWMAPIAIATGNTFVLKPSERDPSAANRLAELWTEAGLPKGVFNVVHGGKTAVDTLLTHPDVSAVSFVGSTPIAKYVHATATAHGKRVQALGGAKNHAVVLPDADIDYVADHLAAAAFGSAGQRCMAVSAVVTVGEAADRVVQAVAGRARTIIVGNGADPGSEMGPIITPESRERIIEAINGAQANGAEVVVDGRNLEVPGHEGGFFVGPTLIDKVMLDDPAYTTELFGPVLVVIRVPDLASAIELVNASPFGNGTAIFTASGEAARTFQRSVTVGMIGVNVPLPVPVANYSFGGWKDSLFGDKHIYGPEGVSFYTRAKVVTSRWPHQELWQEQGSGASYDFPSSE
ncbi:methylmalonate-semialdehyde dehydrogenase (CoA acylating) [Paenarthrobacter ureafaciens]|uniref:CoA-acylating methylmalonate-semialdehyde dehydrogenase n=1 Tax=Paenarthrobacter ureafaciens TaxID=37931 RepID=UPI00277B51EA|nr:CoA-acylating methylmalonate-semialdehyde dehydrogenase [Paenarthrobacter ureafaciens]NWL28036.1 methylmalonate-semialdehyde dehydrogenase (CoA acylating) [Paenarthrobacter ureafaciens]